METKIERLNKIHNRLTSLENHVSPYTIKEVEETIRTEFNIESFVNSDYNENHYLNDLRLTMESLTELLSDKSGITSRRKYFNEFLAKFKDDILSELQRL